MQQSEPDNTAPLFGDQDPNTEGDQSDETSRSVAENTDAEAEHRCSGELPVMATDGDAVAVHTGRSGCGLLWDIDRKSGQLMHQG